MDFLSRILASPQVQAGIISALIAGMVSVLVVWLTGRRNRRAQQAQRAEKLLLEVYNPIEIAFLKNRSLYNCVTQNKGILIKNRRSFSNKIRPLIDQALKDHYSEAAIGLMNEPTLLEKESIAKLKEIEVKLRPLIADEINRLQKLLDHE